MRIRETTLSRRLMRPTDYRDEVHPVRYVHEPKGGPRFRVCFHSTALARTWKGAKTGYRLLSGLRNEYYDVFRTPGGVHSDFDAVSAFQHGSAAAAGSVVLKTAEGETQTSVRHPEQWFDLAHEWFGDRAAGHQLIDLKAAEALGAHVFITTSKRLLEYRERQTSETAVLTPREALPLLWAWPRGFGEYWHGNTVTSATDYYWALARVLTPHAGEGFSALVRGEYVFKLGEQLLSLGQSATVRLANAVESLDRMYLAWQLPTDNHLTDEICDEFDNIVLGASAILDNLALLAVAYFDLKGLQAHQRSLTRSEFGSRLRQVNDARAQALADYSQVHHARLNLQAELRHHAVHRDKLAGIRYQNQRHPEETRIRIAEPALSSVCDHLVAMGEQVSEWGISNRHGPRYEPVSFIDQPRRVEMRKSPGEALLDPMAFAPRLVASTAAVIDEVFKLLDLGSDRLLLGQPLTVSARGTVWPWRGDERTELTLTSPLAGLV